MSHKRKKLIENKYITSEYIDFLTILYVVLFILCIGIKNIIEFLVWFVVISCLSHILAKIHQKIFKNWTFLDSFRHRSKKDYA